jgi:hypothetical protein
MKRWWAKTWAKSDHRRKHRLGRWGAKFTPARESALAKLAIA